MALYIGLMSGTSMDGIDVALVQQPDNALVDGLTIPYSEEIVRRLEEVSQGQLVSLAQICQLNTLIGRAFATAVQALLHKTQVSAHQIKAIGSHGQTICHDTRCDIPYTLQLGCGHTIAALTGIPVVADFRTKDLVNAGQGAPFAPIYHQELFSTMKEPLALVNIGGIANLTLITPKQKPSGWDIGPGNCLMDAWVKAHQNQLFDRNGVWASQGKVIEALLDSLLSDLFFSYPSPKSIGKEYFSLSWIEQHLSKHYNLVDVQATLLELTAQTIANSLKDLTINTLYLCGGGAHNQYLVERLTHIIPEVKIENIAQAGYSPDYLEAMMFSWFAYKHINRSPIDLSPITGSKGPAILGAFYPP